MNNDVIFEKETQGNQALQQLTIASLLTAESLMTGFFCFEKLVEFKMGPDILRREESTETRPGGRPSSPPVRRKQTKTRK